MKHKSSYCHPFVTGKKKDKFLFPAFIKRIVLLSREQFVVFVCSFLLVLHNLKEILKREEKILLLSLDFNSISV